jgi:hypothetical protein
LHFGTGDPAERWEGNGDQGKKQCKKKWKTHESFAEFARFCLTSLMMLSFSGIESEATGRATVVLNSKGRRARARGTAARGVL